MSQYNAKQFSLMVGVKVKTLQKWDRDGKLKPARTPGNRRIYNDEHLAAVIGKKVVEKIITVAYCRVSSQAQRPDMLNQKSMLEQFCAARGIDVTEWLEEVGGGLNFKRPKFLSLVDLICTGRVKRIVIAHKDRLMRFGFDMLIHLCAKNDCELVVMNTESLSPQQEMAEDFMAITQCFSARLDGLRSYKKILQKAVKNAAVA